MAFTPNLASATRLFGVIGNWQMVAQLSQLEINALPPDNQGEALVRLGLIYLYRLGDVENAKAAFARALEAKADFGTLFCSEEIDLGKEPAKELADRLGAMADATHDDALRAQFLLARARVVEEVLKDQAAALDAYEKIWVMDPLNDLAKGGFKRLLAAAGRWKELADVLVREAEQVGGELAARTYFQTARICAKELKDRDTALSHLVKAAELAPKNVLLLGEVAEAYEAAGRWEDLVKVLEQQAALTTDPKELASQNFRIGDILCEKLSREKDSIAYYRKTVEINPAYLPAMAALGKLYQKDGRFQELADLYRIEAEQAEDVRQKVNKLYKMAEILETQLVKYDDAISAYRKVLELQASYLPALKALGRIFGKLGRWADLIEMYERELSITEDKDQAVFLLDKIGWTHEEKLGDIENAVKAYRRVLEIVPNHLPAIRTLAKIYATAKRWNDLLELSELEIDLTKDQKQVVSLMHKVGEIYEENLGDREKAVANYQKVLSLSPSYLPVLKALGRIYLSERRYRDLVDMYRREIEVTKNQEQVVSLLYKIGDIHAEKLDEPDTAIETFEKILGINPAYLPALNALELIYLRTGKTERLAEIHLREASVLTEPGQKATASFRAAEIYMDELKMPEKAIELLEQCLALAPGHMATFGELERVYSARAMWQDLATLYQRGIEWAAGDREKIRYMLSLADLCLYKLDDPARAAVHCEAALGIDRQNVAAFQCLDTVYTRAGDHVKLMQTLERWVAAAQDADVQIALHLRLALIKENRLKVVNQAAEHYLAVLKIAPAHPVALEAMEIMYKRAGDVDGMIAICRHRLTVERDPAVARDLRMRLAHLLAAAGAPIPAIVAELRAAADAPVAPTPYLPAVAMLRDVYRKAGQPRELLDALAIIAAVSRDPRGVMRAHLEAGVVQEEKFNNLDEAVKAYFNAFDIDPQDAEVFGRLERNLTARGEWERLVNLYVGRIAAIQDTRAICDLYLKAARVYEFSLKLPEMALNNYAQAAGIDPYNSPVLQSMGDLQMALGKWQEAAATLSRLTEVTQDPAMLAPTHQKLGTLFHEKLGDPARAALHFQNVVAVNPRDAVSLEHLAGIFMSQKAWSNAINVFKSLIEMGGPADKQVHYLSLLADIFVDGFGDLMQAGTLLRKALELDVSNAEVLDKLARLYERQNDWNGLLGTYEGFIAAIPAHEKISAVPLMLKKGEVCVSRLGDLNRAVAEYRKVLEVAPNNIPANVALAEIYGQSPATWQAAIESNRKLIQIDAFRQESYRALTRIFHDQAALDKAYCAITVLRFLRAATGDEEFSHGEAKAKAPLYPTGPLGDEQREALLVHSRGGGVLRGVMQAVGGEIMKVYPPPIENYGFGKNDRLTPKSKDAIRVLCDEVARQLGLDAEFDVYLSPKLGKLAVSENTEPPAVVVGRDLLKLPQAEQRFAVARQISLIKDNHMLVTRLSQADIMRLFYSAVRVIDSRFQAPKGHEAAVDEIGKRIGKAISKKSRKALEGLAQDFMRAPGFDFATWIKGAELTANRAGLVACNDLQSAVMYTWRRVHKDEPPPLGGTSTEIQNNLNRNDDARDLLVFAVSEEYFALRQYLSLAIA
ncbi:MAG: tetratricopeptide repeat protein [Deltaproteobacteria bacterium]|nr:tetratricopeptide repeat protein [Deltaproteobacteria bacterium]